MSHHDDEVKAALAGLLRRLAAAVESGDIPPEVLGGAPARRSSAPPARAGRAPRGGAGAGVVFPSAFGTLDHRAPPGLEGLVVGGRTVTELMADDRGVLWLEHMRAAGRLKSPRLREAVLEALRSPAGRGRLAEAQAMAHVG